MIRCLDTYSNTSRIVLYNWEKGYPAIFEDMVNVLYHSLQDLNYRVEKKSSLSKQELLAATKDELLPFKNTIYIVFGFHAPQWSFNVRLSYILYNWEQASSWFIKLEVFHVLVKHATAIFDYSYRNLVEIWQKDPFRQLLQRNNSNSNSNKNNCIPVFIIPFGDHPSLRLPLRSPTLEAQSTKPISRISCANGVTTDNGVTKGNRITGGNGVTTGNQISDSSTSGSGIIKNDANIDVLMYGARHARRQRIENDLKARNVKVLFVDGCYGLALRQLWQQTKIVLNVHYYIPATTEQARLTPLLANNICVISEDTPTDPQGEHMYKDDVLFAPYERLVEVCISQLRTLAAAKPPEQQQQQQQQQSRFQRMFRYNDLLQQSGATNLLSLSRF